MYNNNYNRGGSYGRSNGNGYAPRGGSYSRGNAGYNSNGNGYNNSQRTGPKKHSGAKYHATSKNGNPCINAWNYSRRLGLVSLLIAPYKNSSAHKSKSGKVWHNWMCTVTCKGQPEQHFPVLVEEASKRAIIPSFGWVVNPSAAHGGYCGTFTKK